MRDLRHGWTPLRRFHDDDERLGAMQCCAPRRGRKGARVGQCRLPSAWVSELKGFGRVVLCEAHGLEERVRAGEDVAT